MSRPKERTSKPRQPILLGCSLVALTLSATLTAQEATLAPGTALRLELDHRVRSHIGAAVQGHLTEPVYVIDHEVIPAGSHVSGTIRGMHPGSKGDHVRRLLGADFTPLRVPELVFESIEVIVSGGHKEQKIPILRLPCRRMPAYLRLVRQREGNPLKTKWRTRFASANRMRLTL